jgi:hypothetical protein
MPDAWDVCELVENIAAMIEADAFDNCGFARERKLVGLERVVKMPCLLKRFERVPVGNPYHASDGELFLVRRHRTPFSVWCSRSSAAGQLFSQLDVEALKSDGHYAQSVVPPGLVRRIGY